LEYLNGPEKLTPFLVSKIWGGNRLQKIKNLSLTESGPIGELWEISVHPDGPSFVGGKSLRSYLSEESLPFLAKLIDTSENLSVQVHPDDEFARLEENSLGKAECWIILEACPGAGIYLGIKPGVNRKILEEGIKSGKDLSNLLNFFPVNPGDFLYVPPGSVHAIGKNILLLEVQQSSGITYRVWDWDRCDSNGNRRELHIEKALKVINFNQDSNFFTSFRLQKELFDMKVEKIDLVDHRDFELSLYNFKRGRKKSFFFNPVRAGGIICLKGDLNIYFKDKELKLGPLESLLLPPASHRKFTILAQEETNFAYIK
jgi:mannose-6-phosphate isomerase